MSLCHPPPTHPITTARALVRACVYVNGSHESHPPSLPPSAASFGESEQVPWGWWTLLYVCVATTLFSPLTFYGPEEKKTCPSIKRALSSLSLSKRRAEGNNLYGRENSNIRQHLYLNMTTFRMLVTDDSSNYYLTVTNSHWEFCNSQFGEYYINSNEEWKASVFISCVWNIKLFNTFWFNHLKYESSSTLSVGLAFLWCGRKSQSTRISLLF